MATLTLRCTCGKTMSVPEAHRGLKIKCRQCGTVLQVPAARVWTVRNVKLLFAGIARWVTSRGRQATSTTGTLVTRLSWVCLAAMCAITALLWQSGDVWWPFTVLLFIGRWIFLLPIAALAAAALLLRRRNAILPLVATTLVVLGPFMGFRLGWQRLIPHPAGMPFRVVSFNADGGDQSWVRLPDFVEIWRPDVIAIQECGQSMITAVHDVQGYVSHVANGLCFLSKYPIVDSAVMNRATLSRIHGENDNGIGGAGYVIRYTIQTPKGPVNVTNLHLETPRKGLEDLLGSIFHLDRLRENTALRTIESTMARQWVDLGKAPALVMGDFNTPVESRIFQGSWGSFTDAFSHAGFGFGMTKFNGWIRVRIDHVLSGPGWYTDRVAVGADVGSDHRPLVVDLTLAP
jgi:endonuclease/exonuclease/phosphatase (EEP) superfamily protein YafD